MPVPDYQSLMLPLLEEYADGKEHVFKDVRARVAGKLKLSAADLAELLPSGRQTVFDNRVGWARTYLDKAGVLESARRSVHFITERGKALLSEKPNRIDNRVLARFEDFNDFFGKSAKEADSTQAQSEAESEEPTTPEEQLEEAYRALRKKTEAELLAQVMKASPAFFERLVVELLVAMGYGGSIADAGRALGRSGDGGIDGMIKEDHLGLDAIYVQAKRWQSTVGRPEIQAFAGSLEGERARKGVFITTSTFSKDAREYVARIDKRMVLIDGAQLSALMFDFGIGVNRERSYELKRVDSDYFAEE